MTALTGWLQRAMVKNDHFRFALAKFEAAWCSCVDLDNAAVTLTRDELREVLFRLRPRELPVEWQLHLESESK